jgi:hypothetical protein
MRVAIVPGEAHRPVDVPVGFVGAQGGKHRDAGGDEAVDHLPQELLLRSLAPHHRGLPESVRLVRVVVVVGKALKRSLEGRLRVPVVVLDHGDPELRRVEGVDHRNVGGRKMHGRDPARGIHRFRDRGEQLAVPGEAPDAEHVRPLGHELGRELRRFRRIVPGSDDLERGSVPGVARAGRSPVADGIEAGGGDRVRLRKLRLLESVLESALRAVHHGGNPVRELHEVHVLERERLFADVGVQIDEPGHEPETLGLDHAVAGGTRGGRSFVRDQDDVDDGVALDHQVRGSVGGSSVARNDHGSPDHQAIVRSLPQLLRDGRASEKNDGRKNDELPVHVALERRCYAPLPGELNSARRSSSSLSNS